MDNRRSILEGILAKVKNSKPVQSGISAFKGLADKIGGVTYYDSKDHVNSAPEMMRRKQRSMIPPTADEVASYTPMLKKGKGAPANAATMKDAIQVAKKYK